MGYVTEAAIIAAILGVVVTQLRHRYKYEGWLHIAVVFGVPFFAAIVMTILGLMQKTDDAHVAFGIAAVLYYSTFSVSAYVITATISEIVLRKRRSNGRANQSIKADEK